MSLRGVRSLHLRSDPDRWPPEWPIGATGAGRRLLRGERLFAQGDLWTGLHWLSEGTLGLRCADARGNQRLVQVLRERSLVGLASMLPESAHPVSAQALTDCRVHSLDPASALRWLEDVPEARASLTAQLAADLGLALQAQLVLVHWPVSARLCWALGQLAEGSGGGNVLELPLSRQDLASWIGVRPETLAREIRELQRRGIADFSGRTVCVDRVALVAVAHGLDPDQERRRVGAVE